MGAVLLSQVGLTIWTLANVVAAAAFMHFASWTWLEPNLRGEDVARGGDALVWMLSAFPILVLAALCNLVWVGVVEFQSRKTGIGRPISIFVIVAGVWISALAVDYLRSAGF